MPSIHFFIDRVREMDVDMAGDLFLCNYIYFYTLQHIHVLRQLYDLFIKFEYPIKYVYIYICNVCCVMSCMLCARHKPEQRSVVLLTVRPRIIKAVLHKKNKRHTHAIRRHLCLAHMCSRRVAYTLRLDHRTLRAQASHNSEANRSANGTVMGLCSDRKAGP